MVGVVKVVCCDSYRPCELVLDRDEKLQAPTPLTTSALGEQVIAAAKSLIAKGVGNVLVKLGSRGSLMVTRDGNITCDCCGCAPVCRSGSERLSSQFKCAALTLVHIAGTRSYASPHDGC